MKRTRMNRTLRIGLMAVGGMALIAVAAGAEGYECNWDHPCADVSDLTCDSGVCWCEAEWADAAVWSPHGSCGDWPDTWDEATLIRHNNPKPGECDRGPDEGEDCLDHDDCENVCVGGPFAGLPCANDEFCQGQSRAPVFCSIALCEIEAYILIGMADEICAALRLEVDDTVRSDDSLSVQFRSVCVGGTYDDDPCSIDGDCTGGFCGNTLHTYLLRLEGFNGPASLTLVGATQLQPDMVQLFAGIGRVTLTVTDGTKLETDTTD